MANTDPQVMRQKRIGGIDIYHAMGFKGDGYNVMHLESDTSDHGLGCVDDILDIAPECKVYRTGSTIISSGEKVKQADCYYEGKTYAIEDFVREFKIKIVTRSTGGPSVDSATEKYWQDLIDKYDIILVTPAGNNKFTVAFPAKVSIIVGAVGLSDKGIINPKSYTGRDKEVDFAYFTGDQEGTSFAAPRLVGVMLLLMSRFGDKSQKEIYEVLKVLAKDVDVSGVDVKTGWGVPILRADDDVRLKDIIGEEKPKEGDEMLNVIGNLVEHFTLNEMANNEDGGRLKITPEVVRQAQMMEELRKWYNKPMKVNSWYRTKEYNVSVGGDPNSCHLDGIATDISLPNLTAQQITNFINKWKAICKKWGVIGGISIYDTFLHFDSNNAPARYGKSNSSFRVTDFR